VLHPALDQPGRSVKFSYQLGRFLVTVIEHFPLFLLDASDELLE